MLTLELLGPPRVRVDGADVRFDTRKAVALLAVLAVRGRPVPRDELAALLWPELDRTHAHGALRRTLSVAAASTGALAVDRSRAALAEGAASDVARFRTLAATDDPAAWAEAAALASGDFLAGFALRDSPAFDHWQQSVADELRSDLSLLLALLVDDAVRRGDSATARAHARRRVQVDPLSEPAHADLIRVLAQAGERVGALAAYRELVALLRSELGVPPLPSTVALQEAVRAAPAGSATRAAEPDAGPGQGAGLAPIGDAAVDADPSTVDVVTRQIVEAASVLRAPADRELLRLVAGRSEQETGAAVAAALAQGALVAAASGAVEIAPQTLAEHHRSPLPLPRARALHGRAAEALARRRAAQPDLVPPEAVGRHFADAGQDAQAVPWFEAAAAEAALRADHERALEAWRAVVALGGATVAAELAIGTTLARLGRISEALAELGRAAELARDDGAALEAAREALAIAERLGDRHGTVALRSHLADLLHSAGRQQEALAEQRRWATAFAEVYGADAARAWAAGP
ncbi:hypothetical protein LG314_10240 [Agrococcus terreus]|uniref:BTAD domain-containing putative transcriptional regulator n=1 Tax=Agrococcus terreus TaxID=574649 RepID=UPI003850D9F1